VLRIVMDSAGDIPKEWESEFDIHVIPINIHFGEQTFLQGVDLSNADFYRLADESGVIPKTSQPTPQQFVDLYKKIAQPGNTIISLHVTSKLSGTLASAEIAARELADEYKIFPIDSKCGAAAMGYMCRDARIMEREGASVDDIVEKLKSIANEVLIILTLNSMEYARRSGRVKALQAALASLLNVKPIITLQDGVLEVTDRVRTRSRSLDFVLDLAKQEMGDKPLRTAVVHAEDPKAGQMLLEKVKTGLNCQELILSELSIGVAANLGPGTLGIVAYPG